MKCAHLKYYVNTMSTSREILYITPLAYKPNLENLTFKYSNWLQKRIKISSKYIFKQEKQIFQFDSIVIKYSPTDRKNKLQMEYNIEKYTIPKEMWPKSRFHDILF